MRRVDSATNVAQERSENHSNSDWPPAALACYMSVSVSARRSDGVPREPQNRIGQMVHGASRLYSMSREKRGVVQKGVP